MTGKADTFFNNLATNLIRTLTGEMLKDRIRPFLDEDVKADIQLIHSYDDDEIGSLIPTNYIVVRTDLTIKQATHELIEQAGENDNISTIYTIDEQGKFCGAIDLKDLIVKYKIIKNNLIT